MREEESHHRREEFWESSARGGRQREEQSPRKVRHRRIHACEGERSRNAGEERPQRSGRARRLGVRQGERPRGRARRVQVRHHLGRPLRPHAHAMWACCRQGRDGEDHQLKRWQTRRRVWVGRVSPSGKKERRRQRVLACARHDASRLPLRAGVAFRQRRRLPCDDVLALLLCLSCV